MGQDNLKTHDGLPAVKNNKGEVMTEYSITVTDPRLNGGKPTNIPSLWGGQIVSEDEAVENALNTKNEYRSFESIKEAVDDASRKSEAGGANAPKKYAVGGVVSDVQAQGSTSSGVGKTNENFSGRLTYGNDDASFTPSVSYNKDTRQTEFEDGVILNETGKRIGLALNGEVKLDEGVKLRGGIERVTSSSSGVAVYKGEEIGGYEGSSVRRGENIGMQAGKLNLDYSQSRQEGTPTYKKISGSYDLSKDSNISGDIDNNNNVNIRYNKRYAKGGNVEQMNKLFAEGGMMDDSGEQVNGVEVPPGSLREEVADDIPAQLSEGEFVVPADVVRYIGLEKLMAMRDKAKQGLERMEEMGQMGNADEVANPDQTFNEQGDEDFAAEIDDIMAEEGEGYALGGDVTAGNVGRMQFANNPGVDVRYYRHDDGRVMFITYINGKPSTAIPEGFKQSDKPVEELVGRAAEDKAATTTPTAPPPTSGGESSGDGGPLPTPTVPDNRSEAEKDADAAKFQTTTKATALVRTIEENPLLTIVPLVPLATKFAKMSIKQTEKANKEAIQGRVTAPGANGEWSQAAIDAGAKAAATEAGRQPSDGAGIPGGDTGAVTSGSIAAAAASAMALTDGRNAMDAMMDVIGAHQVDATGAPKGTPGTAVAPPPAVTVGGPITGEVDFSMDDSASDTAGVGAGADSNATYICTASYNQDMITPSHFRSLSGYGARLRKQDPYLMRAYDSFGPFLASHVGKNKVMTGVAKYLTNYWKDIHKNNVLSTKHMIQLKASTYVLRPVVRFFGWVLIKFVDKK